MSSPPQPRPTRLVARTTEDVVVLAPLVLGFAPEQSVVLVTFGGAGGGMHARVDLGRTPAECQEVADRLTTAARRNDVLQAAVLAYTDDGDAALAQARVLVHDLVRAGVAVIDAVRVHESRWFTLPCADPEGGVGGPVEEPDTVGTPYDAASHRFTAEHVLAGHVLRRDRAELEASLRPVAGPEGEAACVRLERAVRRRAASLGTGRSTLRREARWVRARLEAAAERPGETLGDDEAARLIVGCREPDVRDAAWGMLSRPQAQALSEVLSDVVRRCPESCVAPAASVLAFCAWLAGDGALAWCAVERCFAAQPGHTLAQLVADLLGAAVPPSRWIPATDDELPLLARGCLR